MKSLIEDFPLMRGGPAEVEHFSTKTTEQKPELPVYAYEGTVVDSDERKIFCRAAEHLNDKLGVADYIVIENDPNGEVVFDDSGQLDESKSRVVIAGRWAEQARPDLGLFWDEVFTLRRQQDISGDFGQILPSSKKI